MKVNPDAALLRRLMSEQFRLSALCAFAFLAGLLGLPLANYLFPEWMARKIGGFTVSWLLLGVLVFPYVWLIAWWFIRRSLAMESELARSARKP